jgi:uncharacterized protein (DUF924 family)
MDARAQEILDYWLHRVGPERWYAVDPTLDAEIRERFGPVWGQARGGELAAWSGSAESCLAYLILLDQFPRNMFRGQAAAFSTDGMALDAAKGAIARGLDERVNLPERQFFYLPLMHSEALADQDRCVRLIALSVGVGSSLDHARAHREIIRRFGRFPYRNDALDRATTPRERAFLAAGGYASTLQEVSARREVAAD